MQPGTSPCSWAIAPRPVEWAPKQTSQHAANAALGLAWDSVVHNCGKRFRIQRRPAYQRAINFFLRHECSSIIRLHRSPVENAQLPGEFLAENLSRFAADYRMGLGGQFRRCRPAGTDPPYRLPGGGEPFF